METIKILDTSFTLTTLYSESEKEMKLLKRLQLYLTLLRVICRYVYFPISIIPPSPVAPHTPLNRMERKAARKKTSLSFSNFVKALEKYRITFHYKRFSDIASIK